jgi:hypothetical protein
MVLFSQNITNNPWSITTAKTLQKGQATQLPLVQVPRLAQTP